MKKMLAAPAVAGVLLLGTASVADAQEAPAQEERAAKADSDKTGLFGLIGLLGLAGLAGLKRNNRDAGYGRAASRCGGVRSGQVQRQGRQPDQFHGERGATPAVRM